MIKTIKKLANKPLTKCPSPTSLWGRDVLSVILTKKGKDSRNTFSLCFYGIYIPPQRQIIKQKVVINNRSLERPFDYILEHYFINLNRR